MISIYILEDDPVSREELVQNVRRYAGEKKLLIDVKSFSNAYDLLENYESGADIVFFDIEMRGMNGMEAAKKIREKDPLVLIVFVTNLAQYAIEGYQVNAFDFILKPVKYSAFSLKLDRICNELSHKNVGGKIVLNMKGGNIALSLDSIFYVEVRNHSLIYHTDKGIYRTRGTLSSLTEKLVPHHFTLCNACYLVNMKYVQEIQGNSVIVHGESLAISQSKRKEFLATMAKYYGGSI